MALETTKTTYLNGSSKDGNRILANFSSSLSEDGTMTINETISESTNLDTVEVDFNKFRELAKNESKKLNGQDTDTDVSSDKSGDKEGDKSVATPTSNNEVVKDDKPAETSTKVDDKPETAKPDEAKVSGVKDSEVKQPTSSEETNQPISGEGIKDSEPAGAITKADDKPETNVPDETKVSYVKYGEIKQPVSNEETKQPVVSEEVKQSATSEVKQPVVNEEAKVSEVKDGENADESNQLRHQ